MYCSYMARNDNKINGFVMLNMYLIVLYVLLLGTKIIYLASYNAIYRYIVIKYSLLLRRIIY